MRLGWSAGAWDDYLGWQSSDRAILARVNQLNRDTMRSPVRGLGKPEPIEGNLKGWRSRRIASEHRLVYRVHGEGADRALAALQCHRHYA